MRVSAESPSEEREEESREAALWVIFQGFRHSGAGDFQFAVMAIGAPPAALDGSRKFDRLDGAQGSWPCLLVGAGFITSLPSRDAS